jgi:methylated-DNA-[protein]-cysteine S-methyltransferase
MTSTTLFDSPIGPLSVTADRLGVSALRFGGPTARSGPPCERLRAATTQLDQYFAGERRAFELPLVLGGTEFQRRVWSALLEIPYATTTTYGAIAAQLWSDPAQARLHARAVGAAVGSTPIPIVIPCHRVVGANGSLTGYGGGLARKRALLDFEASRGAPEVMAASWGRRQLALL